MFEQEDDLITRSFFYLTEDSVSELGKMSLNGSVPQGSWLCPLLYMIMLNDLHSKGLLHKYMDDSTITNEVIDPANFIMQDDVNDIVEWSDDNNIRIYGKKRQRR